MQKREVGEIVVAKNSHKKCGYLRGDTLQIVKPAIFSGDYIAKNLTRPDINGDGLAYLGDAFWAKLTTNSQRLYTVYILGIPLISIRKAVDE